MEKKKKYIFTIFLRRLPTILSWFMLYSDVWGLFSLSEKHQQVCFVYCADLQLLFCCLSCVTSSFFEAITTVLLFNCGMVWDIKLFQFCSSVRGRVCGSLPEAVQLPSCLRSASCKRSTVRDNVCCVPLARAAPSQAKLLSALLQTSKTDVLACYEKYGRGRKQ